MELPFAQRELTVAARSKSTYLLRVLLVGAACAITVAAVGFMFLVGYLASGGAAAGSPTSYGSGGAEILGRFLNGLVSLFQFATVFLLAPLYTAGLIAQEKQEHTLGLLLLADMRGQDLYLAKFLRAYLQVELLLLSLLPFAAFVALLGGVSIPEMTWQVLLYSAYAAAICALGLLFSTVAARAITAFLFTAILTWLWVFATFLADIFLARPAFASFWGINFSVFGRYELGLASLWPQFLLTAFVFAACTLLAIALLPRQIETPNAGRSKGGKSAKTKTLIPQTSAERFLMAGGTGLSNSMGSLWVRLPVFLGLSLLSVFSCVTGYVVTLLMCYDIVSALHAARIQGAFDELALTPLEDREIGQTVLRVCIRHAVFYGAALVLGGSLFQLVALFIATYTYAMGFVPGSAPTLMTQIVTGVLGLILLAFKVALQTAAAAAGAGYIGLYAGSPLRLTLMALGLAVVMDFSVYIPNMVVSQAFLITGAIQMDSSPLYLVASQLTTGVLSLGLYLLALYIFRTLLLQNTRRQIFQHPSHA